MDDHWRWESAQDFPASGPDAGSVDGAAHPDMDGFNCYLGEEPLFNLDGIDHSGLYNSASNTAPYDLQQGAWPFSWTTFDQLSDPTFAQLPDSNIPIPLPHNIPDNPSVAQRPLTDVSQWLDGAYSPPVPCTYCRRHRLQCLIIRTTSANPNPVTACSSCVALFRECSLALGEKRQPSRFETLSPVLGNLHGLREICEDAPTGTTREANRSALPALEEGSSSRNPESKQFVRKGARVLRSWFLQHQSHPYPTEEQKSELVLETGFSRQRISTWFANARRRQKQKQQQRENPNPPASSARIFRAGSPMPSSSWASMTPLERWQASPPEDDPVPESTIRDAIASTTPAPAQGSEPQSQNRPPSASSQDDFSFFFSSPQFDMDLDLDLGGTALDTFLNLDDHETSSHLDSSVSGFGSRRSDVSSDSISSAWSLQSDGGVPLPNKDKTNRNPLQLLTINIPKPPPTPHTKPLRPNNQKNAASATTP
ncbi:hypothetical protein N8T08_002249 [Aspergillus melleus]|uniref:Uncharacterized protein n=1 Tax=Aspergillus melleus TaxID=138277 RepID=A0ACC3B9U5_9EURO|nr:hypothetical protein N8T08_002249 [Aspergillus melleus]